MIPAEKATTRMSGRGVLRLRESVESEIDERPLTRARTLGVEKLTLGKAIVFLA